MPVPPNTLRVHMKYVCSLKQWVRKSCGLNHKCRELEKILFPSVPCLNCGGGDIWWHTIYRNVLSSFRENFTVLSPVWCQRLRSTTGVHLAHCHDEFRGSRSDYVRQVALATTTATDFTFGNEQNTEIIRHVG
ncbi:uncharacterized protein TNCV_4765211 [Trichonephila clavipes]|nr:uncharacterized protein TNCV_4765211 [Trichonephila clavipes]